MAKSIVSTKRLGSQLIHWLLEEDRREKKGPYRKEEVHRQHSWWQVMCLTGVDYFSTLGYQPGIAALAAGALSPIATLILVLLTLFGALPIYRRIAAESPHGEGSIAMLERLLPWWQGKLLVLCLLGFVATDFIITITLSAADATAHIIENPLTPNWLHNQTIAITLILVALLGAVFLRGFREAIGIAVVLVAAYLLLNFIVVGVGVYQILTHTEAIANWQTALFARHSNPLMLIGISLLIFPKLALGLSGFETGVTVMPLVKGSSNSTPQHPKGRIRNTRKLLTTAAVIMSFFLLTTSFITTLLIPTAEFASGGKANGRALAYLAHLYLGNAFGTIYDLSTISILWFAGASAMAGLLNIVPRYLPRYGMAPNWARVSRPLVLVYTAIAFVVTIIFKASVEAQGGAYATGVLVLITSAAFAVTLSAHRHRQKRARFVFGIITLLFLYTTIVNIIERPEGIRIAGFFIGAIIFTSLVSRVWRSTELRAERIEVDELANQFFAEDSRGTIRLIANRLNKGDALEYFMKEKEVREDNHIPANDPILFLEIHVSDASEFADVIVVKGVQVGDYRILRAESAAVPNAIAALLLYIRDQTGKIPHAYFGWVEGNPIQYLLRFILFGEGDIAVVTREVLRRAEKNPHMRPGIHVGG
ncbi:amino acid transporter [Nostoc sp. 'Peltigera membranacea cyanobiont' 210A]|uniref:amino acid transporter n=1 Tax=Nostoc sp. 'Peltigera membranacea cyanobiont' 210A TaxID=2014529 RepID=UPI000B95C743|nr:amino acid transporter [Nostoc sp. 'Peltigera membranacea cyanobiont' 210A]OYD97723.1 amino acid transporter [Nostoc sp. 'Peltigera membranacea cyanobiont' 210A]